MRADVGRHLVAIRGAAVLVTHGVDEHPHVLGRDAARFEEAPQERDELGIRGGLSSAEQFGSDLPELAHAALLRALVAKHRAGVVDLRELPIRGQAVLERRTNHACGGFGTQRDGAAALVLEGVHLLGDDVGGLADSAREDLRMLEEWGVDRLVSVPREEILSDPGQVLPRSPSCGQHVGGTFGCAGVHTHGAMQPFEGVGRQAASVPRARQACHARVTATMRAGANVGSDR